MQNNRKQSQLTGEDSIELFDFPDIPHFPNYKREIVIRTPM